MEEVKPRQERWPTTLRVLGIAGTQASYGTQHEDNASGAWPSCPSQHCLSPSRVCPYKDTWAPQPCASRATLSATRQETQGPSPSYHHPNCVILGKSTNLSGMCTSKMMMLVSLVCFNENQSLEAKRKDYAQIKATGKGIDTSRVGWVHWRRTGDACSKIPSKESAASGSRRESQELG